MVDRALILSHGLLFRLDAAPLNIVTERETADALVRADAYLSTQPARAQNEKGQ